MARHTVVRLVDRNGLRPEPAPKKAAPRPRQPKKAAAASAAEPLRSAPLPPEEAFERRRRALSFWQSAVGDAVTLRMREDTVCAGELLAVDASQTLAHVAGLATPMGTYPFATVRTGDVLRVEFDELWRVSLPPLRDPSAGAAGSGGGGSSSGVAGGAGLADAKQAVTDGSRTALQDAKRALAATFDRQLSVASPGTTASGAERDDDAGGSAACGEPEALASRSALPAWAMPDREQGGVRAGAEADGEAVAGGACSALVRGEAAAAHGSGNPNEAAGVWDPKHSETQKYYVQRYMLFSRYDAPDGTLTTQPSPSPEP